MLGVHKCILCKAGFVRKNYDVCFHCRPVHCDNCKKEVESGMKVEYGEFWCFDCLSEHSEKGPALSKNKLKEERMRRESKEFFSSIIHSDSLRKTESRLKGLRILNKKCRGCGLNFVPLQRISKDNQNFCGRCLNDMKSHVCLGCGRHWDPLVGCDENGLCIECAGMSGEVSSLIFQPASVGICPNCKQEWCKEGEPLCQECLDTLPY